MEQVYKNGKPLESIVISGVSGRFPNTDNVAEFSHNLYNKVNEDALELFKMMVRESF
jgi:hypothetical protein